MTLFVGGHRVRYFKATARAELTPIAEEKLFQGTLLSSGILQNVRNSADVFIVRVFRR